MEENQNSCQVLQKRKKAPVMNMLDVSIIIINYNTCVMTLECIDSIYNLTHGISFEVIVVDNNSNDESKSVLSKDARIRYIYLSENLGFGKANNVGIEKSKGRYVFLLNSDTLLINNAIKILCDYLDENIDVGAAGGNLFNISHQPVHSFQRTSPLVFEIDSLLMGVISKCLFGKNIDFNHSALPLDVKCIVGADLMIRKSVLDETGAFDSRFFMYCEESELLHRIRDVGYRIISNPNARIIHLEGKSFQSDKQIDRIVLFRKSLKIYCNLHYNKIYYHAVNFVWNINVWTRIIGYTIICSDKKQYWEKIKNRIKEASI